MSCAKSQSQWVSSLISGTRVVVAEGMGSESASVHLSPDFHWLCYVTNACELLFPPLQDGTHNDNHF